MAKNKNNQTDKNLSRSKLMAIILATALNPGTPWRD